VNILILRDPREPEAKCSLSPLRGMDGIEFVRYRHGVRLEADGRILLTPDGELLTRADRGRGILLVDCSWRRVPPLLRTVTGTLQPRRLPELVTAYPRRNREGDDPRTGLASIEALYAASVIFGEPREELLRGYHWRDEFLAANAAWLAGASA
jgi:ribosome biogenesis protein Tsr3